MEETGDGPVVPGEKLVVQGAGEEDTCEVCGDEDECDGRF